MSAKKAAKCAYRTVAKGTPKPCVRVAAPYAKYCATHVKEIETKANALKDLNDRITKFLIFTAEHPSVHDRMNQ